MLNVTTFIISITYLTSIISTPTIYITIKSQSANGTGNRNHFNKFTFYKKSLNPLQEINDIIIHINDITYRLNILSKTKLIIISALYLKLS